MYYSLFLFTKRKTNEIDIFLGFSFLRSLNSDVYIGLPLNNLQKS